MSAVRPHTFAEHQIPDILTLLSGMDGYLKQIAQAGGGGGSIAPAQVYTLPIDYDNFLDILVAGGRATAQWSTDNVTVAANSTSTLTINVSGANVLVIRGTLVVDADTHDAGFNVTVTIDGAKVIMDAAALLVAQNLQGADLPAATQSIVFSFQNTTSGSLTGLYQLQEVLVSVNDYNNYLLPMFRAQAQAEFALQGS